MLSIVVQELIMHDTLFSLKGSTECTPLSNGN